MSLPTETVVVNSHNDYDEQIAELVQLELDRAGTTTLTSLRADNSSPLKTKGLKLKRSFEKFASKLRFSNSNSSLDSLPLPPKEPLSKIEKAIIDKDIDTHITSRDRYLDSPVTPKDEYQVNQLSLEEQDLIPNNFQVSLHDLPSHDALLAGSFECRRVGLHNLCLAEQNQGLNQELLLCQTTLVSLRKILQQKVDQIEHLTRIKKSR